MGTPIMEEFVEHSHPQYGRGYFCTEDVLAKVAALEADARRYRFIKDDRRGKFVEMLSLCDAENWDSAIDAALSQEPAEGG